MSTDSSSLATRVRSLGAKDVAFYLTIVAFIVLAAVFFGPFVLAPFIGWFVLPVEMHYVHDMAFGALLFVMTAGMAIQLYRPLRRGAALVLAAFIGLVIILVSTAIDGFDPLFTLLNGLPVLALALHPAGRDALRLERPADRYLGLLTVVAAVPLLAFAVQEAGLQMSATDEHAAFLHYAGMALLSVSIVLGGVLATFGSRFGAWAAGLMMAVFALTSIQAPTLVSSLGTTVGYVVLVGAIAFVAVEEYERFSARREHRTTQAPPAA
ncbi:hypothetical protein [Halomarina rubra]|uniref:Uncharacterized protein n=1 Tax=Halomarina rubra TaxID=2071873 RepID=A0ABD6AQU0_9EURY|nr:hypothetical protein [Halomarina rubra]